MIIDEKWAWTVTFAGFIMNLLLIGLLKSYSLIMINYQEYLQCSTSDVMLAAGLLISLIALPSPIVAILCDRYTTRFTSLFGSIGVACSFVAHAYVKSVPAYLTVTILLSLSLSLCYSPTLCMVTRCHRSRQTLATGISMSGSSFGMIVMPPLVVYLINFYYLPNTVFLLGAIYLHLAVVAVLMPREIRDPDDDHSLVYKEAVPKPKNTSKLANKSTTDEFGSLMLSSSSVSKYASMEAITAIKKKKKVEKEKGKFPYFSFGIFILATMLSNFGFTGQFAMFAGISYDHQVTTQQVAYAIMFQGLLEGIVRVFSGWLADFHFCPRWVFLVVPLFIMGINAIVVTIWSYKLVTYSIFTVVLAISGGFYLPSLLTVACEITGLKDFGWAFSVMLMFHGFSNTPFQYLLGLLKDRTVNYVWSVRLCGICLIVSSILIGLERTYSTIVIKRNTPSSDFNHLNGCQDELEKLSVKEEDVSR